MGLFDSILNSVKNSVSKAASDAARGAANQAKTAASNAVNSAASAASRKWETFTFNAIPTTLEELQALPEASLDTPFKTASLVILALNVYAKDRATGTEMLNFLCGPRPMSPRDIQFINDRFMDGQSYIVRSYFEGATPDNDYTPSEPYTLKLSAGPYAYQDADYANLDIRSGGADSLRQIKLRKKGDGRWFLWEQFLLSGVRQPKSNDPWA